MKNNSCMLKETGSKHSKYDISSKTKYFGGKIQTIGRFAGESECSCDIHGKSRPHLNKWDWNWDT